MTEAEIRFQRRAAVRIAHETILLARRRRKLGDRRGAVRFLADARQWRVLASAWALETRREEVSA